MMQQPLRGAVSANKQNALSGVMSDEEEEGVVCVEGGWTQGAAQHHDSSGGSGGFGSFLVDLYESLVDYLGQH